MRTRTKQQPLLTRAAATLLLVLLTTSMAWAWDGSGTMTDPFLIKTTDDLNLLAYRVNGTHGEPLQADGYSDTYSQLDNDIAYTYSKAWDDATSTENNYEAIGGYYGSTNRYFKGDFNGAGHTISGIRIHRSDNDEANSYQGIFGRTWGANIHGLRLADARINNYSYTGGIVGFNEDGSTVTDCHVANDVCIHAIQSDADNHGGIAGFNRNGTLRDNLAIGAIVTAVTDNTHGAIVGYNNSSGTLQRNYYTACTVASEATGKGCQNADADGVRHAVSIGAADGVTIVPTGTATTYAVSGITVYEGNNGISYDSQLYAGSTEQVVLTLSSTATGTPAGYQYDGYTASAGTLSSSTPTMPDEDQDVTISTAFRSTHEAVEVCYIDASGTEHTAQAVALDGTEENLGTDGQESWYFVGTDISHTGEIDCEGDVNIILCDGKTMTVSHSDSNSAGVVWGASGSTIAIYGQPLGTGTLNINGNDCNGIATYRNLVINGGTVNVILDASEDDGGYAIRAEGSVTINGGNVTANAAGDNGGIYSVNGVTINGGTVNATGDPGIDAYYGSGTITLGWRNATDRICVSSYDGTVKVANGQAFIDEDGNSYSGTLSADDIAGKPLQPHWAGSGTSGSPYIISRTQELDLLAYRVNGTHGQTYQSDGYSGKYFRLANDITYTHTKTWNVATTEDDNNYETIGFYNYSNSRYFCGDFNGAGHTISGIRIHRSGSDNADKYQGIFGMTGDIANIHSLRLADARITGYEHTGGIVGINYGNVTDCHVANNVCIHAVQTDAYYHGGIAGGNIIGTIESCTSAATLSIPTDAINCAFYGGITSYNHGGTLRDNLAIGATVPATRANTHGAIVGHNNSSGTLQRNYYTACTVADQPNATGVGCGNIDDGLGGYTSADTDDENDGAVPALRDQASNAQAIALLAALASTADSHTPVDLGWGAGNFPLQLAGRTLYKDGSWNTLCLPFDVSVVEGSPLDGAEVKTLTGSEFASGTLTLDFSETSEPTLTAGTPYIVRWTKPDGYDDDPSAYDLASPVFNGVTVNSTTAAETTTSEYVDFVGTYQPASIYETGDENTNLYLGSGNTLYYPTAEDFQVYAFRGYFVLKNGLVAGEPSTPEQVGVRAFVLNFGEEYSTQGVTTPFSTGRGGEGEASWFTLNGRRLDGKPTRSGIYINGGKKVYVK